MTETATEQEQPLVFQDEMHKMQHQMLSDFIAKRNDLVGRANAANGDRQTLTEQVRESNSDPEIVEARERWSQAYEDLMALVTPKVEEIINSQAEGTEGIEAEISEIDKTLKPGLTFYKKIYGEDAAKHFPSQDRLKGATVRSSSGGGRRIRGFNVVITLDGESEEFENFSTAAKFLEVNTADLQAEFFQKAGTNDLKAVGNEVNMTFTVVETDSDGNETEKIAKVRAYRTEPVEETSAETAPVADDVDTSGAGADDVDLEAL